MKIKDDVNFIVKEFVKVGLTAIDSDLRKCGQKCYIIEHDYLDDTVLCNFRDDERSWFPKTCVVEDEPEETTPDTSDPIKSLRDEFAMGAMETLLLALLDSATKLDEAGLAETSYKIANAMMEERKK